MNIKKMTIEEKVGQMIGLAFSGGEYSNELRMQIEEIQAGLIIYFKDNCINPKQIFNLNKKIYEHAKIPPFIALDQEGGMVARVTEGIVQSPGAMAIGATEKCEYAYKLAYNMGKDLKKLGFNFNFAPVGDINNNPQNPVINVRSYSENPDTVCNFVEQAVNGYKDAGMMTSVKHFPGHGDTSVDSHLGLPKVPFDRKRLYEMELKPFITAKEKDFPGIMAGHVMFTNFDSEFPTTMSKKIITGLLREELGYKGLVVTDSLTMKAVFDNFTIEEIVYYCFNSGCDIMLLCGARDIKMQKEFYEHAVRLVKEGKIPLSMVDAAVERIMKYKDEYCNSPMAESFEEIESQINDSNDIAFSQKVSDESITIISDDSNLLPIDATMKTLIIFPIIKVVTLAENAETGLTSLCEFMPFKCDKVYISLTPTEEEQLLVLTKVKEYDRIVYCSYNACFNPSQATLINQIDETKLIVVAIRTPYDYNVLKKGITYLCAYEATPLCFKAISKVLTGQIKALGTMPVTLKKKD